MEFKCKICNKIYKSYQSLWNHNHKYHDNEHHTKTSNDFQKTSNDFQKTSNDFQKTSNDFQKTSNDFQNNKIQCEYCNKTFSRKNNLNYHIKKRCKEKQEQEIKSKVILEETIKKIIKNEMKNNKKSTTNIRVNGNIIGTNNDSGPKIIINKTGSENIDQLTYNEVSAIFDNEISSVVKLIELINFNESKPENHSFCSTALESPYLSFYNTDTNTVNKERKRYFFEEVICKSIQNHEILYGKFKNKFNSIKRKKIEDNIYNLKKIKENSFNSKIIGEMIRNLNLLSYNNRDLVQETWLGRKYEHESDEEFMEMLLDDPETQKILKAEAAAKANKYKSDSDSSDSDDRPKLFFICDNKK
jgi:hypothetical protein